MSGLSQQELLKRIMEINKDPDMSDEAKAKARQDLMSGKWKQQVEASSEDTDGAKGEQLAEAEPGSTLRSCCRLPLPPFPAAAAAATAWHHACEPERTAPLCPALPVNLRLLAARMARCPAL